VSFCWIFTKLLNINPSELISLKIKRNSMPHSTTLNKPTRRDFIVLTANTMVGMGAAAMVWPLVDSLSPSADVLALSSTEVDITSVAEGQAITVMWRGKPVFIRHRTAVEIKDARSAPLTGMVDPQKDEDRVKKGKDQWLVTVGICTHLGCVPVGYAGDYNGWFCPCHGSQYDTSGRIRKGPAPKNLQIPDYVFTSDNIIRIG
jgi:ubiquinol-cytochrome c reductase iron-sulfur subunit